MVLVAPSGGLGNWNADQAQQSLRAALEAAERVQQIDKDRIHLVSLSNGGLALSRLASDRRVGFKSLIFISPVFDSGAGYVKKATERTDDRRIFVISGGRDDRVPPEYVLANVNWLKSSGALVQYAELPEADHFLMFSHRGKLIEMISEWLPSK